MGLEITLAGRLIQVLFGAILMISTAAHASETQLNTGTGDSGIVTGQVRYELPHDLGTLSMQIPVHWVGGRAEGVEALWIDQHGSPFKDNVTLVIRSGELVSDSEALLDKSVSSIMSNTEHTAATDVRSKQNGRMFSLDRVLEGQDITQTNMVVYKESADKSYLLILNYTRPADSEDVDFTKVTLR